MSRRGYSFNSNSFEITKREMIVSVAIISVLLIIGLFLSGILSNSFTEKNEKYYTATKIEDSTDQFQYGMKTSIGNSMVYGTVSAIDAVSLKEVQGEFLAINKITERYTMHTRQVAHRSGKITYYTTQIYYTWDNVGGEVTKVNKVNFLNTPCDMSKFGFDNWKNLKLTKENVSDDYDKLLDGGYIYPSTDFFASVGDVRYSYQTIPKEFTGTALVDLRNNDFTLSHAFYYDTKPAPIVGELENVARGWMIGYWILWTIVIGATTFGFVYASNRWLED